MYSVVLMVAMTSGGDTPAGLLGGKHGCCGGSSCCGGVVVTSCCGGSYAGCCGGSSCCGGWSYGCCGGSSCCGGGGHGHKHSCCGGGGFLGGMFGGHKHSCHGSSCCGGSYAGCCGGGYAGCCGGYAGCTGDYAGCVGGPVYGAPVMGAPTTGETIKEMPKVNPPKEEEIAAPATLIVTLPAEAKLSIDSELTTATSARRVFRTAALPAGAEYSYTVTAEVVREGKALTQTKTITVRAGSSIELSFDAAEMATVAAR